MAKRSSKRSLFFEALTERPAHFQLCIVLLAVFLGLTTYALLFIVLAVDAPRANLLAGIISILLASTAALVRPLSEVDTVAEESSAAKDSTAIQRVVTTEESHILRLIADYEHRLLQIEAATNDSIASLEELHSLTHARTLIEALKNRVRELQRIKNIQSFSKAARAHRKLGEALALRSGKSLLFSKSTPLAQEEWETVLESLIVRSEREAGMLQSRQAS